MITTNPGRSGPALRTEGSPAGAAAGAGNVRVLRRGGLWLASLVVAAYLVLGLVVPLAVTLGRSVELQPFWRAYSEQLTSPSLLIILERTLVLAALATVLTIVIGYPVAYAMTLMGRRARTVFLVLLVFPQLTSYLVRSYAWIGLLGVNGPVIVWLFQHEEQAPLLREGRTSGILSQGVITAGDVVVVDDSDACPGGVADFDDLLEKIASGEAYVNVHTLAFPGGEIRGQIR